MNPIRIAAVVRRHWLVLWRGPHRWFEISFWPLMDAVLWGSLGLYMAKAGVNTNATAANLLLAGIVLFWTLTTVQMTMSMSIMDETNTRNLLNVMTTSVTPAEYLIGVAIFGLAKLMLTQVCLTVVTIAIYGFSLSSLGWATLPIVFILILTGWVIGFLVLGLMLRFGPSAEILTWGLNYVMLSLSDDNHPSAAHLTSKDRTASVRGLVSVAVPPSVVASSERARRLWLRTPMPSQGTRQRATRPCAGRCTVPRLRRMPIRSQTGRSAPAV